MTKIVLGNCGCAEQARKCYDIAQKVKTKTFKKATSNYCLRKFLVGEWHFPNCPVLGGVS
jgi:hypothetical protein